MTECKIISLSLFDHHCSFKHMIPGLFVIMCCKHAIWIVFELLFCSRFFSDDGLPLLLRPFPSLCSSQLMTGELPLLPMLLRPLPSLCSSQLMRRGSFSSPSLRLLHRWAQCISRMHGYQNSYIICGNSSRQANFGIEVLNGKNILDVAACHTSVYFLPHSDQPLFPLDNIIFIQSYVQGFPLMPELVLVGDHQQVGERNKWYTHPSMQSTR